MVSACVLRGDAVCVSPALCAGAAIAAGAYGGAKRGVSERQSGASWGTAIGRAVVGAAADALLYKLGGRAVGAPITGGLFRNMAASIARMARLSSAGGVGVGRAESCRHYAPSGSARFAC